MYWDYIDEPIVSEYAPIWDFCVHEHEKTVYTLIEKLLIEMSGGI